MGEVPGFDRCHAVIEPVAANTTTGTGAGLRHIPNDLLEEASDRLGLMSLVCAALWGVGTILYRAVIALLGHPYHPQTPDAIAVVAILLSLALYAYTRRQRREPQFLLDLGLAYLMLTAVALGIVLHWDHVPTGTPIGPQISWIGALTLMFAAIIPTSPGKMLAVGLFAASMNPVGMLLAHARGAWDFGPLSNALLMHYPDYLLAGVAALISRVITKLGHQVNKARQLGSYRLVSPLGKGGMGEVWRARHQLLTREAAIKIIQPAMLLGARDGATTKADLIRRRFEQEAQATASLRSPHTVELYDYGVTGDGVFYYVMELLDGIDLETLVRRFGPQPPARVTHILAQVCRSLADAHQNGLVHRDIKPGNIFLCRMGNEFDYAKVLDFGLVKKNAEPGEVNLTGDAQPPGTPAYLAPELIKASDTVDGRADLYAVGCVAFWLLTGRRVFEEKTAMAMILAHVNSQPALPSSLSPVDLPEALDAIVMRCLAKDPASRPAHGRELERLFSTCPGIEPWPSEEAERWWQTYMPMAQACGATDQAAKSPAPATVVPSLEPITLTRSQRF